MNDKQRLANIKETLALMRGARERGYANYGPGLDKFYYDYVAAMDRLLDAALVEVAALTKERNELRERLQSQPQNTVDNTAADPHNNTDTTNPTE